MEQSPLYYSDGEIVILDNLADFQKLEMEKTGLILSVIVIEGKLLIGIGGESLEVRSHDMLFCPPGTAITDIFSTPDFKGLIFGMSYLRFQKTIGVKGGSLWSVVMSAKNTHHLFHMSDYEMRVGINIFSLFETKLRGPHDSFYKEVMQSLMVAAIYEVGIIIERNINYVRRGRIHQKDILFKRFIELLGEAEGKTSVADYARALCITPKYLSAAVKDISGKSPLVWIHDSLVESIDKQLRNSDRSVKEIAGDLGFSSLSAFGKFTKNHLGMSPREYRAGRQGNGEG